MGPNDLTRPQETPRGRLRAGERRRLYGVDICCRTPSRTRWEITSESMREADRHDPTRLSDHLQAMRVRLRLEAPASCASCEALDAFLAPRFVTTLTFVTTFVVVATTLPS